MKKCIFCNNMINDEEKFCPLCGGNNNQDKNSIDNYKANKLTIAQKILETIRNIKFFYGHIVSIIATLIASITIITISFNNLMLKNMNFTKVDGTLVEIVEKEIYDENFNRNIKEYYYIISYEYDNKEYKYYSPNGVKNKGEIGDKFQLYILTNHPEEADLSSPEGIIFIGKIALGIGIVMAVVCIVNIFVVSYKFVKCYRLN